MGCFRLSLLSPAIMAVMVAAFGCGKKNTSSRGGDAAPKAATIDPEHGLPPVAGSLPPAGSTVAGTAGPTVLTQFKASGAEVGKSGILRFVFSGHLLVNGNVTLTTSDLAVASVPGVVTVPAGASTVDVQYGGLENGTTNVSASFGGVNLQTTITVVPAFSLAQYGGSNSTIEVGAKVSTSFSLNAITPVAIDVPIVEDGSAVSVAPNAHFSVLEQSSDQATVNGAAVGTASLAASYGGQTVRNSFTVVSAASITSVGVPTLAEKGAPVTIRVSVDAVVAKATDIALTSSNPAVLAPQSLSLAAGSTYGEVTVPALLAGQATITATLGGTSHSASLTVVDTATLSYVSVPSQMLAKQSAELSVSLDEEAAIAHQVTLASSAPGVLAVPATVTIPAGQRSAAIALTAGTVGSATITASLGDSVITTFTVVGPLTPTLTLNQSAITMAVSAITNVYANISGTNGSSTVSFASSDPTVVSVPKTMSSSYSGVSPQIHALKAGTATITATWAGLSSAVNVTVVNQATIGFYGPSFRVPVGSSVPFSVHLNAIPAPFQTITFTSSDPTIVAPLPPVQTDGNSTYLNLPPLVGLASGTALITATLGSSSVVAVVYVDATNPIINYPQYFNCADPSLQIGAVSTGQLDLAQAATADVPITVSYAPNGIVTVPVSVTVRTGESHVVFPIKAVAAGATTLTVTAGGVQATCNLSVVTASTYTLSVPGSVAAGASVVATVTANALLPADVSVTLSSSNAATAGVSSSAVTLGPGINRAMFGVTGVAAGSATITAKVGSATTTGTTTVTP